MIEEALEKEAKQSYLDNTDHMQWDAEGEFDYTRGYINAAEPREKKIEELEQENAELRAKYLQATDEGTSFAHLKSLERENAELKDDNKVMADNYSKMEQKFYNNLSKATEIIKELLDTQSCLDPYRDIFKDRILKAEQFLKGENIILEDAQAGNSPFDADKVFHKEMKAYPEEK